MCCDNRPGLKVRIQPEPCFTMSKNGRESACADHGMGAATCRARKWAQLCTWRGIAGLHDDPATPVPVQLMNEHAMATGGCSVGFQRWHTHRNPATMRCAVANPHDPAPVDLGQV